MKVILIIAAVIAVAQSDPIRSEFNQFIERYGKSYRSLNERNDRLEIFKNNLKRIEEHNRKYDQGLSKYKMGINQFADLTKEEFIDYLKSHGDKPHIDNAKMYVLSKKIQEDPDSIDWREQGAVTPVVNQGQCSASWAFSAVGSLEGQYFLATGQLVSFSVQCLVDCYDPDNNGCTGGFMPDVFDYILDNGLPTEADYPYTDGVHDCTCSADNATATIWGYVGLSDDEDYLKLSVAEVGPISAAIDATNLQTYVSGIFDDDTCSADAINHGVLIVGYGADEDGTAYWIVKNTWGTAWGESGYVRMSRDKDNQCGIASACYYPLLDTQQ